MTLSDQNNHNRRGKRFGVAGSHPKQAKFQMSTKRNPSKPDVASTKALSQMRQDIEAIRREEELRSLAADGVIMDEDGNDIDGLRAAEKELKDLLDELGRGDDWEKIRYEACRRFPFKEYKNVPPPSRLPGLNSAKRPP